MLHGVRQERQLAATALATVQGRLIADGAINRAILDLVTRPDAHRRLDGTAEADTVFDVPVTVSIESESGKIDLNASTSDTLSALFVYAGVTPGAADLLADRVIEWRSPGPPLGPDPAAAPYDAEGLVYRPRHGPFRSIGELRLVAGMNDAIQHAVEPMVTVYSRSATIDRQVARAQVLEMLGEAAGTDEAGAARPPKVGEAFTIRARCSVGGIEMDRAAVIGVTQDGRQPYWVMAWR